MSRVRSWADTAFIYLIIVAFLGTFLRYLFINPVSNVNYKFILHAHSHVAFLGWIFNALYAAVIFSFLKKSDQYKKSYLILFVLLQISVVGMLITFPLQGYDRESIIFSTIHMLLSFWFAFGIFKDGSKNKACKGKYKVAYWFIKASLIFMILSSIGPFALGPIIATGLSDTPWYNLSIYYYLHFQYNGWFTFAVLGLFFWLLNYYNISYSRIHAKAFFWLLAAACIPAYALSTLWVKPPPVVYGLAYIAALIQIIATGILIYLLIKSRSRLLEKLSYWTRIFFSVSLIAFIVKNILQFLSAFDVIIDLAYKVRPFIISYLHLVFIGFISIFLIGWFTEMKWWKLEKGYQKTGVILFLFMFLLNETLLIIQPLFLLNGLNVLSFYHEGLLFSAGMMTIGLILFKGKYYLK